jgi:hypothetical protein
MLGRSVCLNLSLECLTTELEHDSEESKLANRFNDKFYQVAPEHESVRLRRFLEQVDKKATRR